MTSISAVSKKAQDRILLHLPDLSPIDLLSLPRHHIPNHSVSRRPLLHLYQEPMASNTRSLRSLDGQAHSPHRCDDSRSARRGSAGARGRTMDQCGYFACRRRHRSVSIQGSSLVTVLEVTAHYPRFFGHPLFLAISMRLLEHYQPLKPLPEGEFKEQVRELTQKTGFPLDAILVEEPQEVETGYALNVP